MPGLQLGLQVLERRWDAGDDAAVVLVVVVAELECGMLLTRSRPFPWLYHLKS